MKLLGDMVKASEETELQGTYEKISLISSRLIARVFLRCHIPNPRTNLKNSVFNIFGNSFNQLSFEIVF